MKFQPHSDLLFSASYDNTIKCWAYDSAIDDWQCKYTIPGHKSTVWQIAFDSTGNFMASCSDDMSWAVWKVSGSTYANKGFITGHHLRCVYSIDWNKDDQIVTAGGDNRVCVFEVSRQGLEDEAEKTVPFNVVCSKDLAHTNDLNCV